jgi:hypothetical protein
MFSKLSTRTLLILMAILAAVVWFTYFNDSNQDDSTFRTVFMELDTTALTAIQLYPKAQNGEEISFTNKGDHWELTDGKVTTQADSQTVQGLIREFANLKSQSLAANSKDQWEAFQVGDTSATRVKLVTPGKTYDVMVGKFGYNEQSRNGLTYVRMYDEDEVYTVSGFLSFTVNQVFNAWRAMRSWTAIARARPRRHTASEFRVTMPPMSSSRHSRPTPRYVSSCTAASTPTPISMSLKAISSTGFS